MPDVDPKSPSSGAKTSRSRAQRKRRRDAIDRHPQRVEIEALLVRNAPLRPLAKRFGFYSTDLNDPIAGYARQSQFAVDGLIGYDFGPLTAQVYLTSDVYEELRRPRYARVGTHHRAARQSVRGEGCAVEWLPDQGADDEIMGSAFRAPLQEVIEAGVILHARDIAHSTCQRGPQSVYKRQ